MANRRVFGHFKLRLAYPKDHAHNPANIQYTAPKTIVLDNDDFQYDPDVSLPAVDLTQDVDLVIDGGDCKLYKQGDIITGHLRVKDAHFSSWQLVLQPSPHFPASPYPISSRSEVVSSSNLIGPDNLVWTLDTRTLDICGYTVRLIAHDRAILNSNGAIRHKASKSVGFAVVPEQCIED